MPAGTVNLKEKPLAEMDLKKYAGELTAASLEKADQPQTAISNPNSALTYSVYISAAVVLARYILYYDTYGRS